MYALEDLTVWRTSERIGPIYRSIYSYLDGHFGRFDTPVVVSQGHDDDASTFFVLTMCLLYGRRRMMMMMIIIIIIVLLFWSQTYI